MSGMWYTLHGCYAVLGVQDKDDNDIHSLAATPDLGSYLLPFSICRTEKTTSATTYQM